MQPVRAHNLTQAQDSGNYVQSIQSRIALASKLRMPGKRGTFAWIAGAVLLCKAFLLFYFVLFCF